MNTTTTPASQAVEAAVQQALTALSAAAFAHPSAGDPIGGMCAEAEKRLRATLASQQGAAPVGDDEIARLIKKHLHTDYDACPVHYDEYLKFAHAVLAATRSPVAAEQGLVGVGAIPFAGFVARHADRSKTDTTTSVAVDASREQIQDHLAVADSRRVQASNSRVYTDAQLAAGVEALGICRGMGIPLSDETVAGVVYDYMTAAGPKRPLTIYMDEDPIDVEQFYRSKGFERMPATPTMTGAEIRDCGWKKQYERQMFIDHGNTGIPFEPIGTTQAVILMDGMRFVSIPPATCGEASQ